MIIQANTLHIPLKDESVHCVVTSPPYFGLRRYQIPDSIWDGDEGCEHGWGEIIAERVDETGFERNRRGLNRAAEMADGNERFSTTDNPPIKKESQFCLLCGAWKGQLGGEPSIGLYVSHLVQIFREVRRVLRPDGVLWLNMGDSYASGKGSCYNPGGGDNSFGKKRKASGVHPLDRGNKSDLERQGLKPKDLCMIPAQVALALRADGWYLRSQIPWIKRNCMPESVNDRPTVAVEYIFLLTKSSACFYDAESIKIRAAEDTHARYARGRSRNHKYSDGGPGDQTIAKGFDHMIKMPGNYKGSIPGRRDGPGQDRRSKKDRLPGVHPKSTEPGTGNRANSSLNAAVKDVIGSRNRRNSDWFFESLQGLLSDEEGNPLAMLVNSGGFSGGHFSTFPEAVVEPCIKAGTSLKGCCRECGSPWERVIEKSGGRDWKNDRMKEKGIPGELLGTEAYKRGQSMNPLNDTKEIRTIGWQPTCSCDAGDPVPCVVMDPFAGSGTTGVVAEKLNRRWVGLDLGYLELQQERLVGIQKEMPLIG